LLDEVVLAYFGTLAIPVSDTEVGFQEVKGRDLDIEITEFSFDCQLLQRCSYQSQKSLRSLGDGVLLQIVQVVSV